MKALTQLLCYSEAKFFGTSRSALRTMLFLAATVFPFAANAANTDGANHSFTDEQGRSLDAEIQGVSGSDYVILKRDNGVPFKVKINVFSQKDRSFIQQWAQNQAHPLLIDVFQIAASPSKVATSNKDSNGQNASTQGFKVELKTIAANEVAGTTGYTVRYVLFKLPKNESTAIYPVPRESGVTQVAKLDPNVGFVFETTKMTNPNFNYHLALWMRVYDSHGTLVQEWTSSPDIAKNETWDGGAQASHGVSAPDIAVK